jgi:uncharacterized membrane protein YoaK (UPF0700 family)
VGPGRAGKTLRVNRPRQQILTLIAIALTFGSGANDVTSFTRLGDVFTSVMTGNIVLLGLSLAEKSVSLASHTVTSIAGYIAGVAGATWVSHGFKARGGGRPADEEGDRASVLPGHVSWVLFAELLLLAGFAAGWEATGSRPDGWAQFVLLAVLAAAMGMQSAAVNEMGLTAVSTTFLTGTLTGLVSSLVSPGQGTPHGPRRFGVLIGLVAGAGLCGLLLATAAAVVPVLPLAALITVLVLSAVPPRDDS